MKKTRFWEAKEYILERLERELPPWLSYHSTGHMLDVYDACERIAHAESVNEAGLTLLLTAALLHDAGFITGGDDHEERSCIITREVLPQFGYDEADIETICGMIRATKVPQNPTNLLEEIICDADLDYLGRDDFELIGDKLFKELKYSGALRTLEEWNHLQVNFLEQHHFFTQTSIQTRLSKKQQNISVLKHKINY